MPCEPCGQIEGGREARIPQGSRPHSPLIDFRTYSFSSSTDQLLRSTQRYPWLPR